MNIEEAEKLMRNRGYHTTARSGDGTMVFMHHEVLCISAEIRVDEHGKGFVKLTAFIKMLQVTTGEFSVDHSRFKDLFEDRIMEVIHCCVDLM